MKPDVDQHPFAASAPLAAVCVTGRYADGDGTKRILADASIAIGRFDDGRVWVYRQNTDDASMQPCIYMPHMVESYIVDPLRYKRDQLAQLASSDLISTLSLAVQGHGAEDAKSKAARLGLKDSIDQGRDEHIKRMRELEEQIEKRGWLKWP